MKKKIEFNADLIGTDGITVETEGGHGVDFVKVYGDGKLRVVVSNGSYYSVYKDGKVYLLGTDKLDLAMYQEVKQLSPEEWWRENVTTSSTYTKNGFVEAEFMHRSHFLNFITAIKSGEVVI